MLNTNFAHTRMMHVHVRARTRGLMIECPWYRRGRDEWIQAHRSDRIARDPEEKRSETPFTAKRWKDARGASSSPYVSWRLLSIDVTINF